MKEKKILLSIAGSDPAGGAGIQADIRTADAMDVYPCTVITALTAQNTSKVEAVWAVNKIELEGQLDCLLEDIRPDAVKIGLIPSAEVLGIIVDYINKFDLNNIIVDPMLSPTLSSKQPDEELAKAYIDRLFPVATLITPNIPEKEYFERISGKDFIDLCGAFLLKGGHGNDNLVVDTLYHHTLQKISSEFQSTTFPSINNNTQPFFPADASPLAEENYSGTVMVKEFSHKRIDTTNTHGTGCILSTAIACCIAKDYHLEKAVDSAIKFTSNALRDSAPYHLGKGSYGPALY